MGSSDEIPKKGSKLKINEKYAENMNYVRRIEESQRLKDRYGKELSSDESPESTDDETGVLDTKQKNLDFLTVLGKIKSKNPEIYDEKTKFYNTSSESSSSYENSETTEKPDKLTLKEYHKKLVEHGGISDEEEPPIENETYVEEQKKLIAAFKSSDSECSDLDELVKKKKKSKKDKKKEEND